MSFETITSLIISTIIGIFLATLKKKELKKMRRKIKQVILSKQMKSFFILLNFSLVMTASVYGMLLFVIFLNKGYSVLFSLFLPSIFIFATVNVFHKSIILINVGKKSN